MKIKMARYCGTILLGALIGSSASSFAAVPEIMVMYHTKQDSNSYYMDVTDETGKKVGDYKFQYNTQTHTFNCPKINDCSQSDIDTIYPTGFCNCSGNTNASDPKHYYKIKFNIPGLAQCSGKIWGQINKSGTSSSLVSVWAPDNDEDCPTSSISYIPSYTPPALEIYNSPSSTTN